MKTFLVVTAIYACCGTGTPLETSSSIAWGYPTYEACQKVADRNSALDIQYGYMNLNWWCVTAEGE